MRGTPMDKSKTMQLLMEIRSKVKDSEIEWKEESPDGAKFTSSKHIEAPGLGTFGFISLTGEITPEGNEYKCYVRAGCLPYVSDATETVDSLDAAKQRVKEMMAAQAGSLAMIMSAMPK
ncbi:MAG: hypothetical protein U9Q67_03690 [Patescibacteria group bacterium]|nr:hypothetical protein [Patescibacteria group bacterium]